MSTSTQTSCISQSIRGPTRLTSTHTASISQSIRGPTVLRHSFVIRFPEHPWANQVNILSVLSDFFRFPEHPWANEVHVHSDLIDFPEHPWANQVNVLSEQLTQTSVIPQGIRGPTMLKSLRLHSFPRASMGQRC